MRIDMWIAHFLEGDRDSSRLVGHTSITFYDPPRRLRYCSAATQIPSATERLHDH